MTPELQFKLERLPDSPGCYLMKSQGEIIYVGKAKNLKNRVRQYFQSNRGHTPKVRAMVEKIDDFDIVLVSGELEALDVYKIQLHHHLVSRLRPYVGGVEIIYLARLFKADAYHRGHALLPFRTA